MQKQDSEQADGRSQHLEQENGKTDRVRNKSTSHCVESVGQAVGVRSDKRCRQITFGVDTATCRTTDKASSNTRVQMSLGRGQQEHRTHLLARVGVVCDQRHRGKPITIGFVSGLVVPSHTKLETGRITPFESTPNGWNLSIELEKHQTSSYKKSWTS